jgi:acyl-CoA thioesterase I
MRTLLLLLLWLVSTAAQAAGPGTILVLGDSLSAAYGIPQRQGWVTLLQERLQAAKFRYRVVNASISGETSAGGASRVRALLAQDRPQVLVLALGANDGLRGLPVDEMRENLGNIIRAARRAKAKVLLVGMRLPPNYGPRYTREFYEAYGGLARRYRIAYLPFLLQGFADRREYFQADGLHPTAAAQPLITATVWKALRPLLARV